MTERFGGSTTSTFVPVEAKLRRPALPDFFVQRGTIIDRLLDSSHLPVVLVTAPAGFGKTVAVAQWDAADPRPFAWVSLDEDDNEPRVLLSYVMHALQRIGVGDSRLMPTAVDDTSYDVSRLVGVDHQPCVLVFDGTDALRSRASHEIVTWLIHHVPLGSQVVLIGRAPPPLEWRRLRTENRLLEVGTDALRLSRDEAIMLVERAGAHLPPGAVDLLLDDTEGWAVGMYLAAVRAGAGGADDGPAALGTDRVVMDYLRDEVFQQLSPSDQDFLRRMSILTALSAPLCDVVLETHRSAEVLRRLSRENIVLPDNSQERGSGWYRIRRLFAEAMQSELVQLEPQLIKPLHARASAWLEQYGDADGAIRHAIASGNVQRSAGLIWRRTPMCVATGHIAEVEGWLEAFTGQQVVSEAKLGLTDAWCALARGRPVDHWISAAERGHYDAARPGEAASVAAAVALLHAMAARHGVVQMSADARLAMSLRADEDEWICTAEFLDSLATYLTGGPDQAQSRLEGVAHHAAAQGDHPVRVAALAELAIMNIAEEDGTAAADQTDEASSLVRDFNLDDLSFVILIPCVSALLGVHDGVQTGVQEGSSHGAEAVVRSANRKLARIIELPPWLGIQGRQVLARAYLLLGDAATTRTLLSEAQTLLRTVPQARVLHDEVYALWRQVEQLPIEIDGGRTPLSTAELRVLQLLPTHLSFEEIGRELFVSRNTVKTQAIAAYRKLGVTSRADAVERAYTLGLLS